MKKLVIAVLAIAILVTLFWYRKTTQNVPLNDTIVVGTAADFPPFTFRDQNDEIVGFDIDIIKEVAKRINMNVKLLDRPFAMLLPQAQLGQIHAIAAGMTSTPERAKKLWFTKPYLSGNPLIVLSLKKNTVNSLEDLKNKDVIVNTGYTADIYMSNLPDINIIRLPKVADAFAALDHGKGFAFVTARFTVEPYLKDLDKDRSKYNIFRIHETDENTALAVSKALPKEFFDKIEKALEEIESDGTLHALKQKWEVT